MASISKVFVLVCVAASVQTVAQRAYGISLRGGSDGTAAGVSFGADDSGATSLATNLGRTALEVQRRGEVVASFGNDITKLPATDSSGEVAAGMELSVRGVPQWSLWDLDTFDEPNANLKTLSPWSLNDRGFCGSPGDHFLGGHCRFGATRTQRTYNLPKHTRVRVRSRVHFIDKWEGQSVSLLAHGQPVWSESHNWCPCFLKWMCEKYGVDSCGRDTPDRLSVKAEAIIAHSGATLDLMFNSSLAVGTDPCYKSWGVDDVSIELI